MKKISYIFCILLQLFFITGCQPITQQITQVNYIVPVWKGSLSAAPSKPEIGWAYYNTTVKKSFIYDGSSWQIMAQDGADGLSIIWKGELSSAPRNPQKNWAYYNTVDGNSYIYNGLSWNYLAKSGRNGSSALLLWLGSYKKAPSNPSEGSAYYNSTEGISYIYSNGSWQVLTKDGTNGSDGKSIIWKGAYSSAPANPQINWAYFNTTDNCSYIWNGTSWNTLAVSAGGDTTVTVSISWIGSFTSAPLNPQIGQAYYNTTVGASYIFDGSVWQQISKDGMASSSSSATGYLITWKGSFSSAPANPNAGWAYYNNADKKSYIFDGSSWQILTQDGTNDQTSDNSTTSNSVIFVSETTETIDGITYVVKSYADVYAVEPYFYTYYKYYYLNGKLRRTKMFYHSVGSDLDYKYNEFVEHSCGSSSGLAYEYIYRENGKLESYIQITYSTGIIYKYEYSYDADGKKNSQKMYQNDNLYNETIFYPNGKTKIQKSYKTNSIPYQLQSEITYYETGITKETKYYKVDVSPSYLNYKNTYYENGKEEYSIYYSPEGIETTKNYYTYYENGNKKTYDYWSNNVLTSKNTYYDDALTTTKSRFSYNTSTGNMTEEQYYYTNGKLELDRDYRTDGTLSSEEYRYSNGNTKSIKKYDSNKSLSHEEYYTETGIIILTVNYQPANTINNYIYHYTSGYTQLYYYSGYLYTYEDGKTTSTSTSSSVYSSKTAYTTTQATTKLEELKKSF